MQGSGVRGQMKDKFTGMELPKYEDYPLIIYGCILKGREIMRKKGLLKSEKSNEKATL